MRDKYWPENKSWNIFGMSPETFEPAWGRGIDWTAEALINILKNHIEHTPEQGIIRIEYEDNPIFTKITTADNGQGIHQKDLPYIFNRFYRGKNASEESVGIGLAMAYEIVKQQGGDITVKSESGEGTEFTLTFYKQHI